MHFAMSRKLLFSIAYYKPLCSNTGGMATNHSLVLIGQVERLAFPEQRIFDVPARIDTGARTSAVWASQVTEQNGELSFVLFDKQSQHYTGEVITTTAYEQRKIVSSMGHLEQRFAVKLLVVILGRKMRVNFTLANRSTQVYPVLVGRNILRGKFVVDVKQGKPLKREDRTRSKSL